MAIYRIKRTKDFCVLPNALLQDKRLSYKARGVLAYLLSKPDNWEVRKQDIITPKDGDSTIRAALQELKEAGYVRWVSVRDAKGQVLRWEYHVYDAPQAGDDPLVDFQQMDSPDVDFPHVEKPHVGCPHVENHPPYKELNKKQRTEKNKELRESVLDFCAAPLSPSPSKVPPAPKKAKPSRFVPGDFALTTALRQWAQTEFPRVNVDYETAKFRDHEFHTAHTDWAKAWRNWIRRAAEQHGNGPPIPASSSPTSRLVH